MSQKMSHDLHFLHGTLPWTSEREVVVVMLIGLLQIPCRISRGMCEKILRLKEGEICDVRTSCDHGQGEEENTKKTEEEVVEVDGCALLCVGPRNFKA